MPVKKNTTPKTPKTHKKVSAKKRSEIKEAIDSLPGLLIEHVAFGEKEMENKNEPPRKKYIPTSEKAAADRHKKQVMYGGILVILFSIIAMLFFNMKSMVSHITNSPSSEEDLLSQIRKDYQETIGTISRKNPSLSESIVGTTSPKISTTTLETLLENIFTSSTLPTSTGATATTTPITTTTVIDALISTSSQVTTTHEESPPVATTTP